MRRKRPETLIEAQASLDLSEHVLEWNVENWIATLATAVVGIAILATLKAQGDGAELERRTAPPRPRSQAMRGEASSSGPGLPRLEPKPRREPIPRREPLPAYRGRGGEVGSWIPQAGAMILPARDQVSPRDIRDAILEARETYE